MTAAARKARDLGKRDPACQAKFHGTESAYRCGCRCPHAREDHRLKDKRRRHGYAQPMLIDATGTIRRLQALKVMGWTNQHVAQRCGVDVTTVQKWGQYPTVSRVTAARVAGLYRELCGVPGPSRITRRRALANGWVSPAGWDDIDDPDATPILDADVDPAAVDEIAVRRVVDGRASITELHGRAERRAAVAVLAERGMTANQIARRVGTGHETVHALLDSTDGQQAA